jgi:hypothetical protein
MNTERLVECSLGVDRNPACLLDDATPIVDALATRASLRFERGLRRSTM